MKETREMRTEIINIQGQTLSKINLEFRRLQTIYPLTEDQIEFSTYRPDPWEEYENACLVYSRLETDKEMNQRFKTKKLLKQQRYSLYEKLKKEFDTDDKL